MDSELTYFIHRVDGDRYGAWYRVVSPGHLEVIGVGMLEVAEFGGYSPELTARSILENFVREQRSLGIPVPRLVDEEHSSDDDYAAPLASDDRQPAHSARH